MEEQRPVVVELLVAWLPLIVLLGLFLLFMRRGQGKLLDANREGIDALRENTEALNRLRQELQKQRDS